MYKSEVNMDRKCLAEQDSQLQKQNDAKTFFFFLKEK